MRVLRTTVGTLRSAGARSSLTPGCYKHWAPLEPKALLVAALAVLCSLCDLWK